MTSLPKPPHGQPCNGCGLCCLSEPCPLAIALFGTREGCCPAVQPAGDGKWACGLIVAPGAFALSRSIEHGEDTLRSAAIIMLGSGLGCDAVEDEEPDPEFELVLDLYLGGLGDVFYRCCDLWGIPRNFLP